MRRPAPFLRTMDSWLIGWIWRGLTGELKEWRGLGCGTGGNGCADGDWKRGLEDGRDLGGEGEVFLGNAALVVGGEGEEDLVIADVDVGVVLGALGEGGDKVDEAHGFAEVGELEGAAECAIGDLPLGDGAEGLLDFVLRESGHLGLQNGQG